MKNINNFTQWKKLISQCDVHTLDRAPKAPRAVWAQYAECSGHFQYTLRVFTEELIREQEIQLECMNLLLTLPLCSKFMYASETSFLTLEVKYILFKIQFTSKYVYALFHYFLLTEVCFLLEQIITDQSE